MISTKGLTKIYGPVRAIDALEFEVRPREVMGFLGPNGAGKTTTLRILSAFVAPTAGTAVVAGRDVVSDNLEARRRIGYLPENNPLYDEMDAAEYLEWTASVRGLRGAGKLKRIRSSVEACGIGSVAGEPIGLLSKGYRQRVGLAAAILHDPPVLLLDEPTSGLDPNQAAEVRGLIGRLKAEKTVLFSTHILSEAQAISDRIIILHRGRIAACGTPQELLAAAGGRRRLSVSVKAEGTDPEAVRKKLESLGALACGDIRAEGGEIRAMVEEAEESGAVDLRERVFQAAVESGWTLLELKRGEASLESAFRELTQ
ncbi:MAG: ATP-binding cassette domain-containing protein [Elusimicrobia bacterium]|nr:ATP-binding cassette domain-containing protein [Elusimicrobiota bacterium]